LSNLTQQPQPTQAEVDQIIGLYNQGQLEKTISLAESLATQYPNALILYDILGAAYMGLKNTEKTIASYQKALQLNPNHTDAHNNMGMALYDQGRFNEAVESYQKAVKLEPSFADAHYNLGNVLKKTGNLKQAIESYKTSLALNPDDAEVLLNCGNALKSYGDFEQATKCYKKLLEFNKKEICDQSIANFATTNFQRATGTNYLKVLKKLHEKRYDCYFEIGSRTGTSLKLSSSPSVAIDPYFQLNGDFVGQKDFCLLFQEKSDDFFDRTFINLVGLKCELGFIDGMHLFEYALKDFINLAKISTPKSIFLFHDPMPWSFEMTNRDYKTIPKNTAWVGDIWKLILIFIEFGMKNYISVLTSAPSGLLAVENPESKLISNLSENFEEICLKWKNVKLEKFGLGNFYRQEVFISPENFIIYLENINFGRSHNADHKIWVSH
jgi:tetratricopeptide (TPR) repeat protein